MTAKNRERLRPLDDPKIVDAFLDIPDRIRRDINKQRGSARSKAICAQIAVAIAILQTTPIRIKNLSEIDIRKNLISRGNRLFLSIDGSQVKNGENIDFELPTFVVELLAWYIKEWRGLLVKDQTNALFPGINGGPKSSATLGGQISKMVFRLTEMEFNPHLFRHAGGKLFLDMQPGQYAVVQRVLGHRSINTTTSVYAGAETRAAGQHFSDVITQRRKARGGRS
jgi:integrase